MQNETTRFTCDGFYLNCVHRSKQEDLSREFGNSQKYFRCFCASNGLYDGKPCRHAYLNGKRLKTTWHPVKQIARG